MKAHIGADASSGLVRAVKVTPAGAAELLRDGDRFMCGDNGDEGIAKRPEIAGSETLSKIDFRN